MGLNPAWRTALLHTIFATGWVEGTPVDVIDGLIDQVRQNMTTLRALAPDSGAYFNEVSGATCARCMTSIHLSCLMYVGFVGRARAIEGLLWRPPYQTESHQAHLRSDRHVRRHRGHRVG